MKSLKRGKSTSGAEILGVSPHGVWLLVREQEFFLSFKEYPWFQQATILQIENVELLHGHHLRWEDLDVDLLVESLQAPQNYPLKFHK